MQKNSYPCSNILKLPKEAVFEKKLNLLGQLLLIVFENWLTSQKI